MRVKERIHGGLASLSSGDALGALAVGYNEHSLTNAYGEIPKKLVEPIPSNSLRTKWEYGEVTDDTHQTVVIANILNKYKEIKRHQLVEQLINLPYKYAKMTSSTGKLRIDSNPYKKRFSITSGATMRISPIGMVYSIHNENKIISEVLKATQLTHNSRSALASSAAIAFAISAILEGLDTSHIIERAIRGAELIKGYGEEDGLPVVHKEIEKACVEGFKNYREKLDRNDFFGGLAIEAVPYVIALATSNWDAEKSIHEAVKMGGDADTIASIAGVLCGTFNPNTTPYHIFNTINDNKLIIKVSNELVKTREQIHKKESGIMKGEKL